MVRVDYLTRRYNDDLEWPRKAKDYRTLSFLFRPPLTSSKNGRHRKAIYTVPGVGQTIVVRAPRVVLYSTPTFASLINAAAATAGVELEQPIYNQHYEDDEMPEFPAKVPCGRVPAFEGADGFNLMEGTAIARYSTYHSRICDSSEIVGWMEENIPMVIPASGAYRQPLAASVAPNSGLPGDTVEGTALIANTLE
ncbi:hypothetical protein EDD16DRAFT_1702671 [Pisolithus croceorrhizus]|nr:hypothetical protein EDD16DRAFT_1702671 [Pisolithus croceorrhizus]KAI6167655.1 hypothetical protein EDD17DRAFT_1751013 [Pisolithus thermaeus]